MLFTNLKKSNSNGSINTNIIATSPPKRLITADNIPMKPMSRPINDRNKLTPIMKRTQSRKVNILVIGYRSAIRYYNYNMLP
jgi:hypothetical protein